MEGLTALKSIWNLHSPSPIPSPHCNLTLHKAEHLSTLLAQKAFESMQQSLLGEENIPYTEKR